MNRKKNQTSELTTVEYETTLEDYRHFATLRRQDMLFVTTVQGAVLAVIGTRLFSLQPADIILSIIAASVVCFGFNSEKRLSFYMAAQARRARNRGRARYESFDRGL